MTQRRSGYVRTNWTATTTRILKRDSHACQVMGCGQPARSVDHKVSVAAGGSHEDWNLAAICSTHKALKDEADRLVGIARAPRERRSPERHPGLL